MIDRMLAREQRRRAARRRNRRVMAERLDWRDGVRARDARPHARHPPDRDRARRALSSRAAPGSHINVAVMIGERPDVRSYSIVGPCADGVYRIAVKRLAGTRAAARPICGRSRPARASSISGARPIISSSRPGAPEYLLIAGGIGVTPIFTPCARARRARARVPRASMPAAQPRAISRSRDELAERARRSADAVLQRARAGGSISPPRSPSSRRKARPTSAVRSACSKRPSGPGRESGRPIDRLRFETFGSSGRYADIAVHGEDSAAGQGDRGRRRPDACWRRWRRRALT